MSYWTTLLSFAPDVLLKLDEASGTFADTQVGNDGTAGGSPGYRVTGPTAGIPYGVELQSGDTITLADSADLDLGDTFTMLFWLRKTATTNMTVLQKSDGATDPGYWVVHTTDLLRLQNGAGSNRVRQTTADTSTTWGMYAFVRNGASSIFEKDAVDDTTVASSTALNDSTNSLVIGGAVTIELASLAIWTNTLLTASDMQTIYDARNDSDFSREQASLDLGVSAERTL